MGDETEYCDGERNEEKETLGLWCYVQEDQGECYCQSNPKDDESHDEPDQRRNRSQIAKCLAPQESGERVLLHGPKTILLLRVEDVRYLCHHSKLALCPGLLRAAEREGVYSQRGREIYLVVLRRVNNVSRRGEVSVEDTFCGRDKIHASDSC